MTIAPLPTGLGVRTRLVDDPVRLLDLLPDREGALAWVHGEEGLVGWGEVARLDTAGPARFRDADRWWRSFAARLSVDDQVGLPGTGPVAFASFTFADDAPGSVVIVPRVVVGRRDGVAWITEFSHADVVHAVRPVRPSGAVRYADGQLSVAGYRQAVAEAVRRMRAGELDKVVLAHDLLAVADRPHDARHLLAGLAQRYPACWSYSVDGLVGATPELLVRRRAGAVWSRVLAGTIWPGPTAEADLGDALLGSVKDRHEHRLAVQSLVESLRPLCASLTAPDEPVPLVLPNVTHLASDVVGTLPAEEPASLLELAAAVHPTAAVGGTPREIAVPMIAALEGMDRGRYTGPVGWVDAAGDGELGIALRCAQLDGPVARLFAGCGIVADSDPDNEVREAAAKLLAVREVMEPRS
ncbi:MAG TPA: isochorismate synthase [Pseudonocardia sp.]|nr:isochorismate synthase [Pseudonocardia sp.]